jgi:sugar phosphate permease
VSGSEGGADSYRWVVLGVGGFGAAAFAALRMGLPALTPAVREEFGLGLAQVGLVFTAVSIGVLLTLVPWGALTDRVGERPVMTVGLAGTGAALGAAAFAPTFATLLAGLLVAAMFGASVTGASGRAVMGWFGRGERGLALGIRQMALPLGGALSSFALPPIVGAGGLRGALLCLGGLALTAAVAAALWLRDAPPLIAGSAAAEYAAAAPAPMRDARQWRLGAASALLVVAQTSLLGFLVLFLVDERDLSVALAAALLGAAQLGGALARLAVGRRSDKAGARVPLLRGIALRNAALVALVAALASAPGVLLYPVLAAASVSVMGWNGLAFTTAAELSGRVRAGTAMSLQNAIVSAGGALGPALFGVVVEATAWPLAFALAALAPALAFVVLAPLEREEERRAHARAKRRPSPEVRIPA